MVRKKMCLSLGEVGKRLLEPKKEKKKGKKVA
jgi:hypothetical protein